MAKVKFNKEELLEDGVLDDAVHDEIIDKGRWSVHHEVIFEKDNKFWKTSYSVGATEYQDERPWEYLKEVECTEVHKVIKPMEVWEAV